MKIFILHLLLFSFFNVTLNISLNDITFLYAEIKDEQNYTQKSSFYYAVNLTNYKIEQENVLTFHFETNISNVQILAKEVEVQKESDLPSNMPSSLSDSTIEISKSDVPNYYHLFFSNIIIGDDLIFLIVNIDSNEKKLFMTTTKCKDTEVDIYLKFNGIEMYRNFIEKQFTQMIVEPKAYDFDIEFRKGNQSESFAPVMFYYQYVTQEELSKFSLTGDFSISFDFSKTSNTTVMLKWKSPFTSSVEKVSVKYFIFRTEIVNDTSTFNICDCDEEKINFECKNIRKINYTWNSN